MLCRLHLMKCTIVLCIGDSKVVWVKLPNVMIFSHFLVVLMVLSRKSFVTSHTALAKTEVREH